MSSYKVQLFRTKTTATSSSFYKVNNIIIFISIITFINIIYTLSNINQF